MNNNEVFVSELVVADRRDAHQRRGELERAAEEWFGRSVRVLVVEVSMRRTGGALQYVMTGRFTPSVSDAPSGRLERAARWLGLVQ